MQTMRRDGRPLYSRAGVVVAAFLVFFLAGPIGTAGAELPLRVHHLPPGLIVRGEPVSLVVDVDGTTEQGTTGEAFVRGEGAQAFTRVRFVPGEQAARVPASALRGSLLDEYVVIRDVATGQAVTVPPRGPNAPYRSWIVDKPPVTNLGAHRFGRLAKAESIVAQAKAGDGAGEIGLLQPTEGAASGPDSFDVAEDGTVWLSDGLHKRLLAWDSGRPERSARTIALPFSPLDIALGPDGAIFVMSGVPDHPTNPRLVHAYNPDGTRRWSTPAAGGPIFNTQLRFAGDGVLYIADGGIAGWTPITDGAGNPLSTAAQLAGRRPYEPLDTRRALVTGYGPDTPTGPIEFRLGIADLSRDLARAWAIRSTDTLAIQPEPPVLRNDEIVAFVGVSRDRPGDAFLYEVVAMRLSTTGRVLEEVAMDPSLSFGDEHFTHVRIGRDGKLYQMQISQRSGLRVARFALGGDAATPSPSPAAASPVPSPTSTPVTPSAIATPSGAAATVAPGTPVSGTSQGEWLLLLAGIVLIAAAVGLLWMRNRAVSGGPRGNPPRPPPIS
jgi:hypothetical protein